jgi:excinuclease ABC subunit B
MASFQLNSEYLPKGDQPEAIRATVERLSNGQRHSVLLGVTGSGKTFTMANVISSLGRPALIIAPNKTLAAQLYHEFRGLFPDNAVEYFVSYYDYYQPEAYIPSSDTYIQKDSSINEMIDKLRHSATMSVLTRTDVVVVASVSCIFGLGAPEDYHAMRVDVRLGDTLIRERLLKDLVAMHYQRNDFDFYRGVFRVRGDRVEIFPACETDRAIRIDLFDDEIEGLSEIDPLRGTVINRLKRAAVFPASHYVTQKAVAKKATTSIMEELKERIAHFRSQNLLVEAQRIEERTLYDLEMIKELGYCNGIENYSRHFTGRAPGEPPPTLLDYFPDDFILFVDESHITIPQLRAMYKGDRSRKETLVAYGFRLPSALDNRPLKFEETEKRIQRAVYVSATPSAYEMSRGGGNAVELIVRPTGLLDPSVEIRPAQNQVDDLYAEIGRCRESGYRVLVTTLTKSMAEDLTDYYADMGVPVRYLHSDVSTLERMQIIQELRQGTFDVLIGINLLREGLDLPEVALVAILDADKEGFLRSTRSLIQTFGRAARNVNGKVIMYADVTTRSMEQAIKETQRRRKIQARYNQVHGIIPRSIKKEIQTMFDAVASSRDKDQGVAEKIEDYGDLEAIDSRIATLKKQMVTAAEALEFEKAARLRDHIKQLRQQAVFCG